MQITQYPGAGIPHVENAGATEIMWIVLFALLLAIIAFQMRKRDSLSFTALLMIGGLSICWQETYANWGPYLLYSPDYHLIPWGSTWWTSPNKPWFLVLSYPVFMTFIFTIMVALIRWARRALPQVSPVLVTILLAAPLFYLNNFALDAASVKSGAWIYEDVIGPILPFSNGAFEPLLWPALPFALFGTVMCFALLRQNEPGHPAFEAMLQPERLNAGLPREAARAVAWIITWNVLYWVLLIMPVNMVREIWGPASRFVP